MSEWQPIETAPKDGTVVLVWYPIGRHPSGNHEFGVFVDFHGEIPEGSFDGTPYRSGWCNDHDGGYLPVEPTHWMPLPQAPGAVTDEGFAVDRVAPERPQEAIRAEEETTFTRNGKIENPPDSPATAAKD